MISKPLSIRRSARARLFQHDIPMVDLDAALRSGTPDAVSLVWDERPSIHDRAYGEGTLYVEADASPPRAVLKFRFLATMPEPEYITFGLSRSRNGASGERLRFECPGCSRLRSALFYNKLSWKCRTCQGVMYLSQYKADQIPDVIVHDHLMIEANRMRRPYERQDVYRRRQEKARVKLAKLGPVDEPDRIRQLERSRIETSYGRSYE